MSRPLRAMGGEGGGDGEEDSRTAALHTTGLQVRATEQGQERRHKHRHQLVQSVREIQMFYAWKEHCVF